MRVTTARADAASLTPEDIRGRGACAVCGGETIAQAVHYCWACRARLLKTAQQCDDMRRPSQALLDQAEAAAQTYEVWADASPDLDVIVVTRHRALVEYCLRQGLATRCSLWVEHVAPADIRGQVVLGVLPLHLAAAAKAVIEVPLTVPQELRGQELTLEQVEAFAAPTRFYRVVDETPDYE